MTDNNGHEEDSGEAVAAILSKVTKESLSDVPIGKVHPNPWNPNRQDDRTYEATRESIREYGFIDPVTAWPHPDIDGDYMALDGEHRWKAAGDEGLEVVDVMLLHGLTPAQARKLTIILNETRGDADVALLGKLLSDIDELTGNNLDLLAQALPYNTAELQHLLDLGRTDWDDFHQQQASRPRNVSSSAHAVTLDFDEAQNERWTTFMDMLAHEAGEEVGFSPELAVLDALTLRCKKL